MVLVPRSKRYGVPSRNQEYFSNVIAEILDLPYGNKRGLATKIARAIFSSMAAALKRGESVHVQGLGTWSVRTRPARWCHVNYLGGDTNFRGGQLCDFIKLPPKRYIHFRPQKDLKREPQPQS